MHKTIGDRASPVTAASLAHNILPAITSLPSLQTFKFQACIEDGTVSQIVRGNSSNDTSLIRDIYCGPEVLFETCVAMKLVDDDDDDILDFLRAFGFGTTTCDTTDISLYQ